MNAVNIADRFSEYAKAHPDQTALICTELNSPGRHYSYRHLDETSSELAAGLHRAGIKKGDRVVLMVLPGPDFFSLAFALFKLGGVLVGVDPGMGLHNLGRCLAEAEPVAFIGNRKAHLARWLLRWARRSLRLLVTTEPIPFQGRIFSLERIMEIAEELTEQPALTTQAGDTAAILFTSGSTGTPKGAVYTHANFDAQVTALQRTFNIQPGEVDLATFPLFALYAPVMGMTSIIPKMDFTRPGSVDPRQIIHAINSCGATSMFGSPALLNRVGRWGVSNHISLPTLRRVLSAGAPVAPAVLERFAGLLPDATQIHTPYGATEALPVSSIGSDEVLRLTRPLTDQGRGICVGRAVTGVEIRIIPITDDAIVNWREALALGPNEIGEIAVRGPQVTAAYFHSAQATRSAKIATGDGGLFHRMGDLGYLDEQGRLWFCGRKTQRVIMAGNTLYTIPCEAVFNTHPKVLRTALVGVPGQQGNLPVLCVELERPARNKERLVIKKELLDLGAGHSHTATIRHILFHPGFPVDIRHNAKINREALAAWAGKRLP